jgi:hypothetical protein
MTASYGKKRVPEPTYKTAVVPASVGGINGLDSLMAMPPQDCIYCNNLMPSEYGLRLRKGYREWASGIPGGSVNTIIAFEGQLEDASADRLWAVTPAGIFDVTLFNTTAPYVVEPNIIFDDNTPEAGFGVSVEFTNDAQEHYLHYADSRNGLWQYEEGTGLWTRPNITGPVVENISFCMSWKARLWYIEENSSDAWYLDPDASNGAATKFTFGSKFIHGGELKALYNWTIDGGNGVDDMLVAISRGGDVLVYQGADPSLATFGIVGTFFIGETPESRRIGVQYGGELYMLSTYGIISIRDLLQGSGLLHTEATPSAKISRFLREVVQENKDSLEWQLIIHPGDGFLQIISPFDQTANALQYGQNLLTRAWGRWHGVPVHCAESWNGNYYFGTKEGSVFISDGVLDGGLLDGTVGQPVPFNILTSFQAPGGDHTQYKRVGFIRPIGVLAGTASLNVDAVYDYNVDYITDAPPALSATGGSLWGNAEGDPEGAIWNENVFDYSLSASSSPMGGAGMGRVVAIGMAGSAATRLNVLGWDISYTTGGML